MKIRTKLFLYGGAYFALILGIGCVLFMTFRNIDRVISQADLTEALKRKAFDLSIFTNESFMYMGERPVMQWTATQNGLKKLIRDAEKLFTNQDDRRVLAQIKADQIHIGLIFNELLTRSRMSQSHRHNLALNSFTKRLSSHVLTDSKSIVTSVSRLEYRTNKALRLAERYAALAIIGIIVALMLVTMAGMYVIDWSVMVPLARLGKGADIIGRGNLDYRLGFTAADELGDVGRAFDQMAQRLKSARLAQEQELRARKEAEEEVLKLNAELEQRVARRTAQLEAANKELEAFSYSVSHDLRAPLRAIDGFSQLLIEDSHDRMDDREKSHLKRIRSATQNMGRLIDGLLQLSKLTRAELVRDRINLSEMADSIQDDLKKSDPSRKVEFIISPEVYTHGDRTLVTAVMKNLFDNAWKFTSKNPSARIEFGRTEHENKEAYFVRDNGVGFSMEYVHKLFCPFQRLHSKDEFPGTGVGLAIVERVIRRHGGSVWADSNPGCGTTFYFTLG